MANVFDQFDTKEKAGNPFDQFDRAEKQKKEPETGFIAGIKSGYERFKGDVGAIGATAGVEGAEEYAAKQREKAGEIYKQPEFTEHPVDYVTGLLGQSLPYMVAPIAAAAVAPEGLLAIGAAGLASAAQFTGSNISRQLEEGVSAKDAKVVNAMAASVPQAALDVIGFKFMPAISKLFSKAGTPLTEQAATSILGKYILPAAKTAGVEGATEAGQQVLERAQAGLSITDPEARKEYFDSFVGGAILGGAISIPGGAIERARVKSPVEALPPEQPPEKPAGAAPKQIEIKKPTEESVAAMQNYYEGKPEDFGLSFADIQNRDRTKPASIQQMNSIANNPDYNRLSVSRDFGSGAPVVISDFKLNDQTLGRIDTVSASDGTKIPVQYAVIEADTITPSNRADGSTVQSYADPEFSGVRPVAGNGRVAGLQKAYREGNAQDYSQNLINDPAHGINPDVIKQIENPVLIRIMPKSALTPDIADKSNVGGQLGMSPTEQAKIDMGRFDLQGIKFLTDGTPSINSLRQFVASMPKEEQAELINRSGQPNPLAKIRLSNALFARAYENDALIDLFAETTDPEAQQILKGMAIAAPAMSNLSEAGDYDIRNYVTKAAEMAVNARRQNKDLAEFIEQGDIELDPLTREIVSMFAANKNAPRRIGDSLTTLAAEANKAAEQANAEPDMFGNVAVSRPLEDVFSVLRLEPIIKAPVVEEEKPEEITFAIDRTPAEITKEISGMKLPQLSQWLVNNAPNSVAKAIAEAINNRIKEYADRNVSMTLEIKKGNLRRKGELGSSQFSKTPNGISFVVRLNSPIGKGGVVEKQSNNDKDSGTNYRTIMHELLHVVTQTQLYLLPETDSRIQELERIFDIVNKQIEKDVKEGKNHPFIQKMIDIKKHSPKKYKVWGPRKNIKEIVTWGLTDVDYQNYLSTIKVGDQTAFSKFVDLIRKFLGLKEQYQSALEGVAAVTENLVTEPIEKTEELAVTKGSVLGTISPEEKITPSQAFTDKSEVGSDSNIGKFLEEKWKRLVEGPVKTKPKGFDHVPDDYWNGINPIFYPQGKNIFKKIDDMRPTFWKRLAQGIADQYRSIKDYSEEAYMLARMSKTVDGALEGLMFFGQVFLDNGALNIKPNSKGLLEVFKPLGEELDSFMIWQAMNRDAELAANNRAPSISQDLVAKRKVLSDGTMPNGKNRLAVYEAVQKDLNQLNRSVLRIAYKQGLIDKKAFAIFSRDINYIPFYKVMEEGGDVQTVATKSGLVNQYMSKTLKGGQKNFGDLMENTLRNWSHILSAAQKNAAAGATMKAAVEQGGAFPNLKQDLSWEDGKVYNTKRIALIDRINDDDKLSDSQKQAKIDRVMKPYVDAINERTDINDSQKEKLIEGLYEGLANGDGKLIPEMTTSEGKGISKIMIGGQPTYFKVEDQLLMEAIASIGYMGPKSKFLDVARDFKNMLQFGVTISPAFKVRNLFRDSISAMAVSDLKKQPWANVVKGWADSDRNNPAHIAALAGGAIFNFGSAYEGDQAKMIRRLIKMGVKEGDILDTPEKIKTGLAKMWDAYQDFGNKSEAANRMALYTQLREKNMNHLQASFYARDMLDFSMQGAWPAMRMVTQVVPFLNARVQGLYKLGRDGITPTSRMVYSTVTGKQLWETDDQGQLTEKGLKNKLTDKQKATQFSTIMTAVALASLMLYMAFKDDEEFKKREEWDRDNFWWFKLPGMETAIRVPKPFEIGAFGTMAERTAEQIMDKSAEGKTFEQSLKRMLSDTFAMNPIPQMIRPLVDLYANKDSFTGAPIETAGMERLSKEQRIAEKTSPLAIALSKLTNVFLPESAEVSPVQTDYAIKSYFGWLGGTASATSHYAVMPFSKSAYPDQNWTETMSLGFIKSLPTTQSKYVTAFYENNKEISQAYADMRHYAEIGETEKAYKIIEEKGDLIAMAKVYDKVSKDMSKIRQAIMAIRADENMTGAQKKEEIDRLKIIIGELAEQAEDARKSLSRH